MLNSKYICNNVKIFINLMNIFRNMTYTKTIKYKNGVIFSRATQREPAFSLS